MKWTTDLIKDIRTNTPFDDVDGATEASNGCTHEVTDGNRYALLENFVKVRNNCSAILEIGVNRNGANSFTQILLKNKLKSTIYLGVDIDNKSFLDSAHHNIYTIQENSSNFNHVMKYAKYIGITEFDFIFIDGDHSINQVLRDWEYTNFLSRIGIVGFHDTAYHYGPNAFVNSMNLGIWNVIPNSCNNNPNDFGIGFAWKKL
jgi:hypothetical protein